MAQKGSSYERQLCKDLSNWWTCGSDDSCFWRTAGSGGRATNRAKKGRRTTGACGDIAATCADGEPLLAAFAIEAKRGYNRLSLHDLLDSKPGGKDTDCMVNWLAQAERSRQQSGAVYWLLLWRRDTKASLAVMPSPAYELLRSLGAFDPAPCPLSWVGDDDRSLVAIRLDDFLGGVTRQHVLQLLKESGR